MSMSKARQNPPPALPPPKQIPGLAKKSISEWDFSSCQEKDLQWRDVVLSPFMSPSSREQGQSGHCRYNNFTNAPAMNRTISPSHMKLDESHQRGRDLDTVIRSNRWVPISLLASSEDQLLSDGSILYRVYSAPQ